MDTFQEILAAWLVEGILDLAVRKLELFARFDYWMKWFKKRMRERERLEVRAAARAIFVKAVKVEGNEDEH